MLIDYQTGLIPECTDTHTHTHTETHTMFSGKIFSNAADGSEFSFVE